MGLCLGGLIVGRIFASEIWGLIFGRSYLFIYLFFFGGGGAYYQNFTVCSVRHPSIPQDWGLVLQVDRTLLTVCCG